tara:strand:- start:57 stop:557 length:501 start_codon:yes stop_codon:yes gene_type:complete
MKIISSSPKGNFIYEKNNSKVLELIFSGWFSNNAKTNYKNREIKIETKNFWKNKFKISEDDNEKGAINFNFKNNISIQFTDESSKDQTFEMKCKGFWKSRYEIKDQNQNLIITIHPKMNWKKLKQNYEIVDYSNSIAESYFDELIIYCGFSIIIYSRIMSSVSSIS